MLCSRERPSFNLPDNDDCEIEQVPRIAKVGPAVSNESVSDDFHYALDREDNQENVFDFFL